MDRTQLFRIVFASYVTLALLTAGGFLLWHYTRPDTSPDFEAERLETNEKGAIYKVTSARGADGKPLQWSDLQWSLRAEPLMDSDGIVQEEETFFVHTAQPGVVHVISLYFDGFLLWSGAFEAEEEDLTPRLPPAPALPPDAPGDLPGIPPTLPSP